MKKITQLIIVIVIILSICSCDTTQNNSNDNDYIKTYGGLYYNDVVNDTFSSRGIYDIEIGISLLEEPIDQDFDKVADYFYNFHVPYNNNGVEEKRYFDMNLRCYDIYGNSYRSSFYENIYNMSDPYVINLKYEKRIDNQTLIFKKTKNDNKLIVFDYLELNFECDQNNQFSNFINLKIIKNNETVFSCRLTKSDQIDDIYTEYLDEKYYNKTNMNVISYFGREKFQRYDYYYIVLAEVKEDYVEEEIISNFKFNYKTNTRILVFENERFYTLNDAYKYGIIKFDRIYYLYCDFNNIETNSPPSIYISDVYQWLNDIKTASSIQKTSDENKDDLFVNNYHLKNDENVKNFMDQIKKVKSSIVLEYEEKGKVVEYIIEIDGLKYSIEVIDYIISYMGSNYFFNKDEYCENPTSPEENPTSLSFIFNNVNGKLFKDGVMVDNYDLSFSDINFVLTDIEENLKSIYLYETEYGVFEIYNETIFKFDNQLYKIISEKNLSILFEKVNSDVDS